MGKPEPAVADPGTPAGRDRPVVLVAIAHPAMRRYTREVLERECSYLAEPLGDRELLVDALHRLRPDLLVIDTGRFPDCCEQALAAYPHHRVIVIGPEPDTGYHSEALGRGAGAWIPRDRIADQLPGTAHRLLPPRHQNDDLAAHS